MGHMGVEGRTVITWILEIAVDNYPELLYKSHMINIPWVFNTIWFFVKNLIDENTQKKVTINSSDYMDMLLKECPIESVPARVGGKYTGDNRFFLFDVSENGPHYYLGHPKPKLPTSSSSVNKAIELSMSLSMPDEKKANTNTLPATMPISTKTPRSLGDIEAELNNVKFVDNDDSNYSDNDRVSQHPGDTLLEHWHGSNLERLLEAKKMPEIASLFKRVDTSDDYDEDNDNNSSIRKSGTKPRRRRGPGRKGMSKRELRCDFPGLEKGCGIPGLF